VKETTAQDAPGSTIAPWDDLRVGGFSNAAETETRTARLGSASGVWATAPEPCTDEEAVDAAGPVDAQNAPTGLWKTADGFPRAPTAIIGTLTRRKITKQESDTATNRPTTTTECRRWWPTLLCLPFAGRNSCR
jgi:hypothetical protein